MRICFVIANPFALKAFLAAPIAELHKRGWAVTVALNLHGSDADFANNIGAKASLHHIDLLRPIAPLADLRAVFQLWRLFRQEKFDIVHSLTPKAGLLAILAAWMAAVPRRVHTFTGQVWATRSGKMRWLLKTLDRVIAHFATALLVDGHSQRDFLVREGIASSNQLKVLGEGSVCGVDTQRFAPNSQARVAIRRTHQIPTDALVLLYLGRLHVEKGLAELVAAFHHLRRHNDRLHLLLVGPDEWDSGLGQTPWTKNPENIHLVGLTAKPEQYMAAADIFCLPSYREGFGQSLLEAAAAGLPSVASQIYGISDAVVDGTTGLLVPARDVEGLTHALTRLIDDPALRHQLGQAARQRAIDVFSQTNLVTAWYNFYAKLSPLKTI
ncbi:MAG: glycosyltransferase family 4 protein [Alphaproteobacteria bacterium]|nr:glycosyltransferase family 4 protein [Alphaproteobacteria bacterium]